jgi:hypothetical protein
LQRRKLPRPRIQRAFALWFDEAATHLTVPVRLGRRTDQYWEMTFGGETTPVLSACLHSYGIDVEAHWQNVLWDLVLSLDAAPERMSTGYVNMFTLPEYRMPYATREAFWRGEVFEPFASWVNDTLASAHAVGLWGSEGSGATWAKLLAPKDMAHLDAQQAFMLLPIRDTAEN